MSQTSESASEKYPPQLTKEQTFFFFGDLEMNAPGSSLVQPQTTTDLNLGSPYLKKVAPKCIGFKRPRSAGKVDFPVNNGSAGASNNDLQASLMHMFEMNVEQGHVKKVTEKDDAEKDDAEKDDAEKDDAEKDDADSDWGLQDVVNSTTYANHASPVKSSLEEGLERTLAFSSPDSTLHGNESQAGPPANHKKHRTRVTRQDTIRGLFI